MRRLHRPLRASLLAAALSAVPLTLISLQTHAQQSRIDLPAGPLGRALSTFASQRGIALSFDPALTAGLLAPALHGEISDRKGLEKLLAGSGLQLIVRGDGSYVLEKGSITNDELIVTPALKVDALRSFPYSEGMVLDQDYIDGSNKGNGDIGTLLRINPSVQFSETDRSSRTGGEIRPADISINGAQYYQNAFLLDGININNDIDPASDNPNHYADVPSQSQGIAIDTDLLESVTVYDSNVPATYGDFTGGVVDAKLRKAGDELHGKVWLRMQRSAWDEVLIPEAQITTFRQSATYSYQPSYDKYKAGVSLQGRSASGIGLIGTVTRTHSDIPLRGYTSGNTSSSDSNTKTQKRENTAATLKVDWANGDGLELDATIVHAPTDNRYFIQNAKNAWFDIKSGGPVIGFNATIERDVWKFKNTLNYSDLENSRRSQVSYWKSWAKSEDYDWGVNNSSFEGSWGNVDQNDRKIGYKFQADREIFDLGKTQHAIQLGASYQHRKADYERLNNHYSYLQPYATTSCTLSDGTIDNDSCSLSPVLTTSGNLTAGSGQYFRRRTTYRAGEFSVSGDEWSAWLQDDMRIGDWSLRPGLRAQDDSIWKQVTLSPRLAVSWDIFGKQNSVLTAGINRYYGRNFFSYLLRDGRERLTLTQNRTSSSTAWSDVVGTTSTSSNRLQDVDIPYTNELTIGLDQQWKEWQFSLKYVSRAYRDEVVRRYLRSNDDTGYYSTNVYEYTNDGRSDSSIYTLTINPTQPLELGPTRTNVQFAFDYTDIDRNYNTYETEWEDVDELVIYKGNAVWLYDLPATDYARKWTVRLSTQTRIPLWRGELLWSNFLRYRAGFRDIVETGSSDYNGETLAVYSDVNYPRAFTFDTTLEYTLELPREQQLYARIEAENVLNRANHIQGSSTSSTYYEPGRSYWLEVGYRF
jgi:hypothetical protein